MTTRENPRNDIRGGLAIKERGRSSNCKNRVKRREMIRLANEIPREEENIDSYGKLDGLKIAWRACRLICR